jgi:hypothetical protein
VTVAGWAVHFGTMVLLETAIAAGLGYTAYSLWSISRSFDAEEGVVKAEGRVAGVEFYKENIDHGFPLLINTGIVIFPLSLGNSRDEEFLHSKWGLADGTVLKDMKARINEEPVIRVSDTEKGLQSVLEEHQIASRPFSTTPPIISYSYDIKTLPVWYDVKAGVISTERKWVAMHAAWARRPAGAVTVAAGMAVIAAGQAIKHSYSSVLPCDCLTCKYKGGKKVMGGDVKEKGVSN